MVYSNADITKAEQAADIIAFAGYWKNATGADPGPLVFDSQLTTYKILGELSGRGITWLTLRQRGKTELARLDALPASAWKTAAIVRPGRHRHLAQHRQRRHLRAALRSHHPVLIDAGFAELETPIPWWDGRPLRFRFPPR